MRNKVLLAILEVLCIYPAFLGVFTLSPEYDIGVGKGGSMFPTINQGDLIIIKSPREEIKAGMIVAYDVEGDFAENGELIIHRVIRIEGERLITKGDSDVEDDWLVTISDVKGVYLFRIPYLGYLSLIKEKFLHEAK